MSVRAQASPGAAARGTGRRAGFADEGSAFTAAVQRPVKPKSHKNASEGVAA